MMGGGRGVIWEGVIRLRDSLETWNLYHGLIKEFFVIVVASLYAIALQTGRHFIRPLRLSFVFDYQKSKYLSFLFILVFHSCTALHPWC